MIQAENIICRTIICYAGLVNVLPYTTGITIALTLLSSYHTLLNRWPYTTQLLIVHRIFLFYLSFSTYLYHHTPLKCWSVLPKNINLNHLFSNISRSLSYEVLRNQYEIRYRISRHSALFLVRLKHLVMIAKL